MEKLRTCFLREAVFIVASGAFAVEGLRPRGRFASRNAVGNAQQILLTLGRSAARGLEAVVIGTSLALPLGLDLTASRRLAAFVGVARLRNVTKPSEEERKSRTHESSRRTSFMSIFEKFKEEAKKSLI